MIEWFGGLDFTGWGLLICTALFLLILIWTVFENDDDDRNYL